MLELQREVGGVRKGLSAISIERNRIFDASVEDVYAVLDNPEGLIKLLPRVTRLRMQQTSDHSADLTTWMQFALVGEVRIEGEISWQAPREVVYRSRSTLPVVAHWTLSPHSQGCRLSATLDLNLVPLLGPLTSFVPEQAVKEVMGRELDKALNAVAAELTAHVQPVR